MEQKVEITCPISVGDSLYRLDKTGNILREVVRKIEIRTSSYKNNPTDRTVDFKENTSITFMTFNNTYGLHQLGEEIFYDKKDILKKIAEQL